VFKKPAMLIKNPECLDLVLIKFRKYKHFSKCYLCREAWSLDLCNP